MEFGPQKKIFKFFFKCVVDGGERKTKLMKWLETKIRTATVAGERKESNGQKLMIEPLWQMEIRV